ncbi:MAG: ATP-binding protein [Anaerolineae bacterium]|nr:ATP-binding protein [Anaerolineae bacterium]
MSAQDQATVRGRVAAGDLAHLREEALENVLIFAAIGWYGWCATLFPGNPGFNAAWRGPALMAVGLGTAFLMRKRHPSLAGAVALAGMAAGALQQVWLQGLGVTPYLLAVVVGLTGLLFNLHAVLAAMVACGGLVIAIGSLRWGHPAYSPELLAPALVIGAVGVTSALAVRNLYTALYWAWDRTMAAQRNEKELRERRAELARTAKALDEACQRLEHMNYDLAQAREAAEEARLLKQQFTTNVSHELRTPLNVIVAFSEMMYLSPESYGGVPLPPEYLGDVREIYRASQSLLHLIDDVLDLSQIEAQRMRLRLEPVSLAEVVSEALDIIRPLVRGKEIELSTELPVGLPRVLMDRARVRQVLLNLLNNARRFTPRGSITVRAVQEDDEVRVTVADTGIGIAPSDHEKVFQEFRQLDGTITRQRDGTGLGLAISKRFVEMHGGRIWVESEGIPGRGSSFHFTLPLGGQGPAAAGLQRTGLVLKRPAGRGRTLLAVGQDAGGVRLLEQALEEYRIVPVADPAVVPQLVAETQPRAVLLNPAQGRAAWLAARQLRRALAEAPVPVLLCPLVTDQHLGRDLGVVEYLVKPISRQALMALLDRLGAGTGRVLIIDDDPRMAQILLRMIRSAGRQCQVRRALRGQAGLRAMQRERPDLVLLDLVMPGMDGRAVLSRMREDPELRSIPVAIITAQEHTPEVERRLSGGVIQIGREAGFSNEEALAYLRQILEATSMPSVQAAVTAQEQFAAMPGG